MSSLIAENSLMLRFFCVPETKGRALEELDACFEEHISARKFSKFMSTGAAGRLAALEGVRGVQREDFEARGKMDGEIRETERV